MPKKIGQRVKILEGMTEFVGKHGTIVSTERHSKNEPLYYRVELDQAVRVPGVGYVKDDIWQGQYLRNVKA